MYIPKKFYTKRTYITLLSEKFGRSGAPPGPLKATSLAILVLKSVRRTKATRSKNEARSAKRKSGGLFVPEAQEDYINFFIYPIGF
ncbi:hypothetical protein Hanom_Chr01g00055291 [Helianthus anomalus]